MSVNSVIANVIVYLKKTRLHKCCILILIILVHLQRYYFVTFKMLNLWTDDF